MRPGTLRYHRSLGFVGATAAESSRNTFEKAVGLDFTGTPSAWGGSGVTVGAAPTTILFGVLGSAVWMSMKSPGLGNAIVGFAGGAVLSTIMRGLWTFGV